MSGRFTPSIRRWVVVAVVIAVTLAGRLIDVRRVAGIVKGDEATYVAMALSLVHDGDLKFDARDLRRFEELYREGPEGIFLKRTYRWVVDGKSTWPFVRFEKVPVPVTESLSFAKAMAYPLAAAPFVAVGGLGGMLMFNLVLLALCVWCAVRFAQARIGPVAGGLLGVAFIVASVVPVFGAWLTSEIFNFALVLVAYFLWLYKRVAPAETRGWLVRPSTDLVAAALLGVATYSKPGVLVAPLLLVAVLEWWRRRAPSERVRISGRHLAATFAVFLVTLGGLFLLTVAVTGEWNFQGGDRKSFYGQFPFNDPAVTFDTIGGTMSTNDADTGMVLAPETLRLLPANAWYFLTGRDAGLVPFYFPGVAIAVLWLVYLRSSTFWQWMIALACAGSIVVLLIYFPFTWNGAGGPPGNRYFLAVYPTMLFLLPSEAGIASALVALVVGVAFTGAMVLQPFAASADTWHNIGRAPLRWLPIELTIVDDLPVRLNPKRGRILFVHDPTVLVYYMDANTYDAEGIGFWLKGGGTTDIVMRTEQPLTRIELDFTTRVPNSVTFDVAGRSNRVDLRAEGFARVRIAPRPTLDVHGSYPYLLHFTTANGFVPAKVEPGSKDVRNLGVFVHLQFMYGPHGEPLAPSQSGTSGGG